MVFQIYSNLLNYIVKSPLSQIYTKNRPGCSYSFHLVLTRRQRLHNFFKMMVLSWNFVLAFILHTGKYLFLWFCRIVVMLLLKCTVNIWYFELYTVDPRYLDFGYLE